MKVKNHKIYILLLLSFLALTTNSCSNSENDENINSESKLSNNLLIKNFNSNELNISQTFKNTIFSFEVNKSDHDINSNFTIANLDNKVIYETQYDINTSTENYKLYQTEKVIDIANNINYDFKQSTYAEIEYNMHIFLINTLNEFHNKNISPILNLLYFHNSIVSVKKRSKETFEKDCECTLHPGYLLDKTGFICQEDFFVPIEILNDLSTDSNEDIFDNETDEKKVFKQYIEPLTNSNEKYVTFDKFYSFFVSKERFNASIEIFKREQTKITEKSNSWCLLGSGSSHGCCGNYSGCCYYVNPICYVHDKLCTNCTPRWFCFSGCVPDYQQPYEELPYFEPELLPSKGDLDNGILINP
ncbi:hypothetical protein [Flavivirga jejuensis]|uniref:Lipoprotein n=1 Tax=Flavivirga jejuensis TaxID=870487 RepID=A0ABT8WM85_9FLAO|nr:hypothetical protein [Flavivirga jejuensis]MDO5974264.1 hypothetical protein [Flavivirga jejuensis]